MITVDVSHDQFMSLLRGYPDRLRQSLMSAITRLSLKLQAHVKEDKLSGQVLHVRTGTLRRSINREVRTDSHGITAIVGTNVVYAKVHEYGFDGVVDVKAHVRRSREQLGKALRTRKDGTTYYSKNGMRSGEINVRAHSRHMHVPERSFLRSSLEDMRPEIVADITEAAKKAWQS